MTPEIEHLCGLTKAFLMAEDQAKVEQAFSDVESAHALLDDLSKGLDKGEPLPKRMETLVRKARIIQATVLIQAAKKCEEIATDYLAAKVMADVKNGLTKINPVEIDGRIAGAKVCSEILHDMARAMGFEARRRESEQSRIVTAT